MKSVWLSEIPAWSDGKLVRPETRAVRLRSFSLRLNLETAQREEPATPRKRPTVRLVATSAPAKETSRVAKGANPAGKWISRVVAAVSRIGKCAAARPSGNKCVLREMFTTARIMRDMVK